LNISAKIIKIDRFKLGAFLVRDSMLSALCYRPSVCPLHWWIIQKRL